MRFFPVLPGCVISGLKGYARSGVVQDENARMWHPGTMAAMIAGFERAGRCLRGGHAVAGGAQAELLAKL